MSSKVLRHMLLAVLALSPYQALGTDTYLALKERAVAAGERLLLKDVVDEKATSAEIISQYGNLCVDELVSDESIRPPQILVFLARSGMDLSALKLISPASANISVSQSFGLLGKLKEGVIAYANAKEREHKFFDAMIEADKLKNLPYRQGDKLAIESVEGSSGRYLVKASIEDSKSRQKSFFSFQATLIKGDPVLVAKKDFLPGDEITRDGLEIANGSAFQGGDFLSDSALLSGGKMVAKQMIEKGTPILKSAVNTSTFIEKGALVSLVTGDNRFQVRTMGRVKEILDNGSSVLVENVDSKKEIVGKPISANEVRVIY